MKIKTHMLTMDSRHCAMRRRRSVSSLKAGGFLPELFMSDQDGIDSYIASLPDGCRIRRDFESGRLRKARGAASALRGGLAIMKRGEDDRVFLYCEDDVDIDFRRFGEVFSEAVDFIGSAGFPAVCFLGASFRLSEKPGRVLQPVSGARFLVEIFDSVAGMPAVLVNGDAAGLLLSDNPGRPIDNYVSTARGIRKFLTLPCVAVQEPFPSLVTTAGVPAHAMRERSVMHQAVTPYGEMLREAASGGRLSFAAASCGELVHVGGEWSGADAESFVLLDEPSNKAGLVFGHNIAGLGRSVGSFAELFGDGVDLLVVRNLCSGSA